MEISLFRKKIEIVIWPVLNVDVKGKLDSFKAGQLILAAMSFILNGVKKKKKSTKRFSDLQEKLPEITCSWQNLDKSERMT